MSYTKATLLAAAAALLSSVSAHGTVSGIVVNGKYTLNQFLTLLCFPGYSPSFQFANPEPKVAGWRIPGDLDNGFVAPSAFGNPGIICHKGASNPLGEAIPVTAGSEIELQWTPWPESHKGPVIDYLAACNGDDCSTVDKTTLEFFKIGEAGLKIGSGVPGTWASDDLIANNNTWVAMIPADIAPGNYVLRHEIIALHSSGQEDGAQNYPQCINIVVSGPGAAKPSGVVGTKLYTSKNAGILVNIYQNLASYVIPGPKLFSSGSAPEAPAESPAESSAPAAPSSVAAPSTSVSETAPAPTVAPGTPVEILDNTLTPEAPAVEATTTAKVTVIFTSTITVDGPGATALCDAASTVTVKGPNITAAGATVTVTAAGATKTVEVAPSLKAMPSGAGLDDLLRWVGDKVGGNGRRHAREVAV